MHIFTISTIGKRCPAFEIFCLDGIGHVVDEGSQQ
jgi:hypothetical protein